jgi:hypothetical protein
MYVKKPKISVGTVLFCIEKMLYELCMTYTIFTYVVDATIHVKS